MSRRNATVRPRRTKDQAAAKQQTMKDSIAIAEALLVKVHDDLNEVGPFVFVCIQALRAKTRDDVGPDVATVLDAAYEKLGLDVNRNVRDALQALGQDGGK